MADSTPEQTETIQQSLEDDWDSKVKRLITLVINCMEEADANITGTQQELFDRSLALVRRKLRVEKDIASTTEELHELFFEVKQVFEVALAARMEDCQCGLKKLSSLEAGINKEEEVRPQAPVGSQPTSMDPNLFQDLKPDLDFPDLPDLNFDLDVDLDFDLDSKFNFNFADLSQTTPFPQQTTTTTLNTSASTNETTSKRPPQNRRWCPAHLQNLIHSRRPKNLPNSVPYTDTTEIWDIPTAALVPPYTTVVVYRVDGQVVRIRVESRRAVAADGGGGGGDGMERQEETPFVLSVVDGDGVKVYDMAWRMNL